MAKEEKFLKGIIVDDDSDAIYVQISGAGCTKMEQAAIICSMIVDFADNEIDLKSILMSASKYWHAMRGERNE